MERPINRFGKYEPTNGRLILKTGKKAGLELGNNQKKVIVHLM